MATAHLCRRTLPLLLICCLLATLCDARATGESFGFKYFKSPQFLGNGHQIVHWSNRAAYANCVQRVLIGAFYLIDPSGRSASFAYGRRDFNYSSSSSLCVVFFDDGKTFSFSKPPFAFLFCRSLAQRNHVTRPANKKISLKKIVKKNQKNQEN